MPMLEFGRWFGGGGGGGGGGKDWGLLTYKGGVVQNKESPDFSSLEVGISRICVPISHHRETGIC